jgi:hypothetical protein
VAVCHSSSLISVLVHLGHLLEIMWIIIVSSSVTNSQVRGGLLSIGTVGTASLRQPV